MAEIDRSLIGTLSEPYVVEVEKGAIRKFADAVGDGGALYRDEAAARAAGYDGIPAPPTFPTSFRPPQDPLWLRALDKRRIVAGQFSFAYRRPLVAGMRLECRIRFLGVEDKTGSKGGMELLHQQVEGRLLDGQDRPGELVFTAGRTTIYRSLEQVRRGSLA